MRGPYGMEVVEDCRTCSTRKSGFFCQLPAQPSRLCTGRVSRAPSVAGGCVRRRASSARRVHALQGPGEADDEFLRWTHDHRSDLRAGRNPGLHGALSGEPDELTAEALQPCQVNFVRREDFLKLLREHVEASAAAMQQISNGYREICQEVRYLGLSRSASEKVAQFLLESSANAQETTQGKRFSLGLTHEEISQVVGISRETVTRTMTDFKNKMLIATKGSVVAIRDESGLRAQAAVA